MDSRAAKKSQQSKGGCAAVMGRACGVEVVLGVC
jgi:hypothetical protein